MNRLIRYFALTVAALLMTTAINAQQSVVQWQSTVEHIAGNSYRVVLEARIDAGWHMYDMGPYEDGPNATTITFALGEGYTLDGGVEMLDHPIRKYDDVFGMEIGYFEHRARFAQKVNLTKERTTVRAMAEWMCCNEETCLPPDDREFSIEVVAVSTPASTSDVEATRTSAHSVAADDTPKSDLPDSVQGAIIPAMQSTDAVESSDTAQGNLWSFILSAIAWALLALLTPCVFPMIPMTVSFFMKGSENVARGRFRAFMYGLFIVLLYTVPIGAIILITWIAGGDAVTADIFNWLATHWLPNLIFFAVFMIFAASFFGAFEIVLPSRVVNRSDSKADRGGLGGIFFMALTLVLVSFSCTGPIVGTVLIQSTSGQFWTPILTMFVFSIVFALPFTLFALFPGWLKRLPKSGGWLNSVKVVLGFVELALGLKFLSVADQVYHWGILDREIYLALWIVIFTLLGFYLLGKLKFKHDTPTTHLSVTRLMLSIVTFAFVVYMLPGMWGAPLKGISGYLPPLQTQDFVLGGAQQSASEPQTSSSLGKVKYGDFLKLPDNFDGFFDYDEALAYARKVGKPMFVDFTGHGCVNCREMEQRVWTDPRVRSLLREKYVILALYSDDKKIVDEQDWVVTKSGTTLKGLGKINSYLAKERFGVNAQPYYILLDTAGNRLVPPRGYDLDVNGYVDFLNRGLEAFNAVR